MEIDNVYVNNIFDKIDNLLSQFNNNDNTAKIQLKKESDNFLEELNDYFTELEMEITNNDMQEKKKNLLLQEIKNNFEKINIYKKKFILNKKEKVKNVSFGEENLQLIDKGDQLYGKMEAKIEGMRDIMKQNKHMVDEISKEVNAQREKLLDIDRDIEDSQGVLNRTKEAVRFFAKHFNSDIYFKILLCISMLLTITIIITLIIKNKGVTNRIKYSNLDLLKLDKNLLLIFQNPDIEKLLN